MTHNSIKNSTTHHTNKLTPHTQTNRLPAHPTSPPLHQPHQTHKTDHALSNLQRNQPTRSYQHIITPQLTSQKNLTTQQQNLLPPPHKPIISQHIVTSLTSHLPLQNLNTHQNISHHSHNTTQSTTTLLATYHHLISPKKSLITQPAKLIDTQLYQKQHHTHHTNKLTPHLQTNHLPAHPTSPPSHQPPQTFNTTTHSQTHS